MNKFDKMPDRHGTDAMKWDRRKTIFGTEDVLPLWVADMDFEAPLAVQEAWRKRVDHNVYGYTYISDATKDAVKKWIEKRHQWTIDTDWLSFSPGVITSLHIAIQLFTEHGDDIVIQTPVYTPFFNLVRGGGRTLIENELIYENGTYTMDLSGLETAFQNGAKTLIFCSPHNPSGRVWTRDELNKLARLCEQYDVLVLSDEIHADLVFSPNKHIPLASISNDMAERTITFMSATKTFNLAGMQSSYIVTKNTEKRVKLQNELNLLGFSMLNTFGTIGLKAAYEHAEDWLDELLPYLERNRQFVIDTLEKETNNKIQIVRSEGTYLLWMDCSALHMDAKQLESFFINEARVGLNAGAAYGDAGKSFMRINIACPFDTLKEAVNRIVHASQEQ